MEGIWADSDSARHLVIRAKHPIRVREFRPDEQDFQDWGRLYEKKLTARSTSLPL